jgi:hypothetical protein
VAKKTSTTETPVTDSADPTVETSESLKPKRIVKRRPVWVCVPTDFIAAPTAENADPAAGPKQIADKYRVYRCETKDAVRDVLKKYQIDPINLDQVLLFRADPMKFKISQQLIVRF